MNFDQDVESFDDYLTDDEPDLHDPKYRFNARVKQLMQRHNGRTKQEAEAVIREVIYTKESGKRCKCGEIAQFVVRGDIFCYDCHPEKDKL
jgi:hypothetical protein